MWAYVTAAPPGTSIHHSRSEGMSVGDQIGTEILNEIAELRWRFTAFHFENGSKIAFPERLSLRELIYGTQPVEEIDYDAHIAQNQDPKVRAMLQGG
ncbi:Uncharacterised protein [Mycobacteroides abscessus subsp. abscessus]|nr:hypothetical protein [Mycobacteroides abscessus]SID45785.1 Uncharacterised protein [Mycobacteroides abscessus subsp. abscessus]SIG28172.1 Uncharacterised protein [Mycobacteroides abscessus subsp. abscessus]SIM06256.1 Uncharacterised protein [Mycobacteroides abscessus subsp. abscessus]SKU08395.1 Uncharacterised protein [Mycobacteroides abscessus subsp. abscessus]